MPALAVGRVAKFWKFEWGAEQKVKYLIWNYTPGRKLKITTFQRGDVWDLYVSLNSNFYIYVDINSNDSDTKFERSWGYL